MTFFYHLSSLIRTLYRCSFFHRSTSTLPQESLDDLNDSLQGIDVDEQFVSLDVTHDTVLDMTTETLIPLALDPHQTLFWQTGRPDVVAGLAKTFVLDQTSSPYLQQLIHHHAYTFWGGVASARLMAALDHQPCTFSFYEKSQQLSLKQQSIFLSHHSRLPLSSKRDFFRSEDLPLSGVFLGDAYKAQTLRLFLLFSLKHQSFEWPLLPDRLSFTDEVPLELPGLILNTHNLSAQLVTMTPTQAESHWVHSFDNETSEILFIPDWACWLLHPDYLVQFSFSKINTQHH